MKTTHKTTDPVPIWVVMEYPGGVPLRQPTKDNLFPVVTHWNWNWNWKKREEMGYTLEATINMIGAHEKSSTEQTCITVRDERFGIC